MPNRRHKQEWDTWKQKVWEPSKVWSKNIDKDILHKLREGTMMKNNLVFLFRLSCIILYKRTFLYVIIIEKASHLL